jgi:hypothetical protein
MKNPSITHGASLSLPVESPDRLRFVLVAITAALALSACSDDGATSSIPVDTISPSDDAGDADVPDEYLEAVLTDVATRTGLPQEEFTVLDDTAVEWADQRLGCVHFEQPSEPMPVDGFRVVVDTGQAEYDYRLDANGDARLCGDPVDTSKDPADEGEHDEDEELPDEAS